jgi:hypothetical protein
MWTSVSPCCSGCVMYNKCDPAPARYCGGRCQRKHWNGETAPASHQAQGERNETPHKRLCRRGGGRGLHSITSQLNFTAFHGTRVALRGCVARVKGVVGGV